MTKLVAIRGSDQRNLINFCATSVKIISCLCNLNNLVFLYIVLLSVSDVSFRHLQGDFASSTISSFDKAMSFDH